MWNDFFITTAECSYEFGIWSQSSSVPANMIEKFGSDEERKMPLEPAGERWEAKLLRDVCRGKR